MVLMRGHLPSIMTDRAHFSLFNIGRAMSHTVVHVTHEAIQKIGGIGAVLQGMLTSKTYLARVPRNILVGPFWPGEERGDQRLGPQGEVLYSSMDSLFRSPLAPRFREIEQKFDVGIVYGRRKFVDKETGVVSTPEILLLDVSRYDMKQLGEFKFKVWKTFGIDSSKYEYIWDYEQYMRLAQPAIACMHALGVGSALEPAVVLSHAPHRRRPSRPRHHVLQRHERRHGPGPLRR
jgi:hypothetical protein